MAKWLPLYKYFMPVAGDDLIQRLIEKGFIRDKGILQFDSEQEYPEYCMFCRFLGPESSRYVYKCMNTTFDFRETRRAQEEGCLHPYGLNFEPKPQEEIYVRDV